MKKSLVALAALAATGAFAQSTVTLSGNLSFGHLVNTARTVKATGVSTVADSVSKTASIGSVDNFNSNRITLTAVEDLGGGLKATGVIDNRLTTANAARATGDMFVKVEGGFGAVQIGQYTFASHAGWNAGASRTVSATATSAQSLSPNVVSYTTPSISGLTASAALDLDTSAGTVGKDGWGVKFNYAAGPIGAQVSYTIAPKVTASMTPVKVLGIAASYDLGVAKVFYNQTDVRAGNNSVAPTSNGYLAANATTDAYAYTGSTAGSGALGAHKGNALSVQVPVGAATLKAGFVNRKGDTNVSIIDRSTVGVDYALSKRTTLTAEFGQDKQAVTGANRATNSFVGVNHTF